MLPSSWLLNKGRYQPQTHNDRLNSGFFNKKKAEQRIIKSKLLSNKRGLILTIFTDFNGSNGLKVCE